MITIMRAIVRHYDSGLGHLLIFFLVHCVFLTKIIQMETIQRNELKGFVERISMSITFADPEVAQP